VVLLQGDTADASAVEAMLALAWPAGVDVRRFGALPDALAALAGPGPAPAPDVVFCEPLVADGAAVEVVEELVALVGPVPVVVVTGAGDPSLPVRVIEAGAHDYLVKGAFDVELLARTLRHALARSRADQAIRGLAFDLEVATAELEEYLGVMAHELRAPLRTGRLFADRLLAAVGEGSGGGPMADGLDASLGRMETMIERLLWLSDLRHGAVQPVEQPLSAAVDDVVADLQAGLADAGLDGADPGASFVVERDGIVRVDPVLFRELLGHLTRNSIRYRSPDRDLVVRFGARTTGATTTVTVRDNGIGVEPRHRDRVFRLFERIDPERDGLGFGLACCRRIVELHRGRITLASPPDGVGTEGRIVLPARM
jgi:signal transduction histidine kinase